MKRSLPVILLVLLTAATGLSSSASAFLLREAAGPCATCGMEGCGAVCCCAAPDEEGFRCGFGEARAPGLYAAGCSPADAFASPGARQCLVPRFAVAPVGSAFPVPPSRRIPGGLGIALEPVSPPPRSFFSL